MGDAFGQSRSGETPLETAQREIREECTLNVTVNPRPVTAYPATRLGKPMIVIVYAADYLSGEVVFSEEHDSYRWLTPDEFAETSTLTPLIQAARMAFTLGT